MVESKEVKLIFHPETQGKIFEIEEYLGAASAADAISAAIDLAHSLVCEMNDGTKILLYKEGDSEARVLEFTENMDGEIDIEFESQGDD